VETRTHHILIVEDNLGHQRLTEYALKGSTTPVRCTVVRDGQEILDYLERRPPFGDRSAYPDADLILLDLNLPKRDGREVLRVIKSDPRFAGIPVVVLSTSDREEDVRFAIDAGAVEYISKSAGFDVYTRKISEVARHVR